MRYPRVSSSARTTTARRLATPILVSTADTWWSAVFGEMYSRAAISAW